MTDYSKMKKEEVVYLLEQSQIAREQLESELQRVSAESQSDADAIQALKADLRLYEMTITRLTVDETVRQEMEGRG